MCKQKNFSVEWIAQTNLTVVGVIYVKKVYKKNQWYDITVRSTFFTQKMSTMNKWKSWWIISIVATALLSHATTLDSSLGVEVANTSTATRLMDAGRPLILTLDPGGLSDTGWSPFVKIGLIIPWSQCQSSKTIRLDIFETFLIRGCQSSIL